jgi:hypothetical protein
MKYHARASVFLCFTRFALPEIADEEHPDQRSDGSTEARSGGEQLDNVNPANGREAWTASHIVKGDESHERDEQGNQKIAPIAHGISYLSHPPAGFFF